MKVGVALPATLNLPLEPSAQPGPAPLFGPPAPRPPAVDAGNVEESADTINANEPADAGDEPEKKKKRRTPQPKLRGETLRGELDEADRYCTVCGLRLEPMPGQVESSEVIDVRAREYVLVRVERQKYRCTCGGCIETALAPETAPELAVEGGRYSLAVAAEVAVDKYVDHLPLERQVRIMGRGGLVVTSQTLWGLVWSMAESLEPAAKAVLETVLTAPALGVDTTSWKNLHKSAKTPFQLWCLRTSKAAYYDVRTDKSASSFKLLLGEFKGWISSDMAGTNLAGVTGAQVAKLTGCWSHAFRKFREAAKNHPGAEPMCKLIGKLFAIEERDYATSDERGAARQAEARPVLAEIKQLLEAHRCAGAVTSLDKAMTYLGNHWPHMTRYVESGDAWICNNPTERGLRGPVIGRRNHFGSKSDRGRKAAGIFYTLVETAKLVGLDPAGYLVAAAKAARRGELLTPAMLAERLQANVPT